MRTAILYDPSQPDNFYIIIAKANNLNVDTTSIRNHMEEADRYDFRFYVIAIEEDPQEVNSLESWYVSSFENTWRFKTEAKHLEFKDIERIN